MPPDNKRRQMHNSTILMKRWATTRSVMGVYHQHPWPYADGYQCSSCPQGGHEQHSGCLAATVQVPQ